MKLKLILIWTLSIQTTFGSDPLVDTEQTTEESLKILLEEMKLVGGKINLLAENIDKIESHFRHEEQVKLATARMLHQQIQAFEQRIRNRSSSFIDILPEASSPVFEPCGGIIELPERSELTFTNRGEHPNEVTTCIWFIRNTLNNAIKLNLTHIHVNQLQESQLTIHPSSQYTQNIYQNVVSPAKISMKIPGWTVRSQAVLLIFKSVPGEKFHLNFPPSSTAVDKDKLKLVYQADFAVDQNYLVKIQPFLFNKTYQPFERRFIILESAREKFVNVFVDFFESEDTRDFMNIFKFSAELNKLVLIRRFTGMHGPMKNVQFQGDKGQPLLIYFESDESIERKGFQLSYSYTQQQPKIIIKSPLSVPWGPRLVESSSEESST